MRGVAHITILLGGLALGACSHDKVVRCGSDVTYLEARSANPVRVPDDLTLPDETESLRVPEPGPVADPAGESEVCLENSPAFSSQPAP